MESRLKQIRKQLGLNQTQLAEILYCSKENISMIERGKSSLSERNKKCLVKKFNLSPLWLEGENVPMLAPAAVHAAKMEEKPSGIPAGIPLYDMGRDYGLAELFKHTRELAEKGKVGSTAKAGRPARDKKAFTPTGWISIPGMPRCDGAIRLAGDGMDPVIESSDVVMYSRLDHTSEIFWGELYLVAIETSGGEYVAVRYLHKSDAEGKAILSCRNPSFADSEIELSKIRAIAFVKGSIHINSSK